MKHPRRAKALGRSAISVALLALLGACAAAPPKLASPQLRDHAPLAGLPSGAHAGWPSAQWWKAYDDPQLDRLIDIGVRQAPDLALARSRLQSAQQSVRLAAAQAGLSINGSAQFARQRITDNGLIPSRFLGFSWYNQADLGVQFDYHFDWWGKQRAAINAALDQAHAAEAERSAAAMALQNAIADTYFGWQADQARLQVANQAVRSQQRLSGIYALRLKQGVDLPDEAQRAAIQLAATREQQIAIAGSAQVRRTALAALLGVAPAQLPDLQILPLPEPSQGLPTNARLDLISRRPDIAASRWRVEAALRQTDAARAAFFPDVSISALAGLSSIDIGKFLTAGSRVFSAAPALHLPIFNGGQLKAAYGATRAQLDGAVAQYDATVIKAAREVAIQALITQQLAARRQQQEQQQNANRRLLAMAQARARQGVRDLRESLAAHAALLQQQDSALRLHAQALSTELDLINALGGGYRAPTAGNASGQASEPSTASSIQTAGTFPHERH